MTPEEILGKWYSMATYGELGEVIRCTKHSLLNLIQLAQEEGYNAGYKDGAEDSFNTVKDRRLGFENGCKYGLEEAVKVIDGHIFAHQVCVNDKSDLFELIREIKDLTKELS